MADKNLFLQNYYFYGHQAEMVDQLKSKIDSESGAAIFSSSVELFIMSAVVGAALHAKAKPDPNKEIKTNILAEQFNSHNREISLAFKYVTLIANENESTNIQRLNKTFRNPETDENYQQFEEYMLGGLQQIYDSIMLDTNVDFDGYLNSVNSFLNKFKDETDDEETEITGEDLI